jgi:hypothetical protein
MRIKQVSVFVGNETGRLVEMLTPLARSKIDILALSVADSADFGIVRLVVSDPEKAVSALHAAGFTLRVNEVLCYQVPDVPGGLLRTVVEPLAKAGINLEYFYAFVQSEAGKATVVVKASDLDGAEATLKRLQQ